MLEVFSAIFPRTSLDSSTLALSDLMALVNSLKAMVWGQQIFWTRPLKLEPMILKNWMLEDLNGCQECWTFLSQDSYGLNNYLNTC